MRVTKDREERRQELLGLAEKLFLAKGYAETAVSDIVREAGVAQGTFYYHFKSKDDVLAAIVLKTVAELETQLMRVFKDRRLDPRERLRCVMGLLFEAAARRRELIAYIHSDANALLHHRLMGTTTRMLRKHLVSLVREGRRKGQFRVPHVEGAVDFLLGGIGQFLHASAPLGGVRSRKSIQKTIGVMLARGLGLDDAALDLDAKA